MVIIHRDNSVYQIPNDTNKQTTLLNRFYHLKFEHLLKSKNIPYKLVDYENYDGDYFVGRFAHAIPDKELHSKCFDNLYDFYGENMWPNKNAYYYYDDKVRQYELLEKYGIHVPSVTCNDLDELLKNVTLGTVIKSTYGAGSESTFYIWEKEHLDQIEEYISECYNSENFFPCQIQDYIKDEYEYQIFISDNELHGFKIRLNKEYESPLSFPHEKEFSGQHWVYHGLDLYDGHESDLSVLKEGDLSIDFIEKLCDIKKELNTPNIKFDVIGNRVLEFSYIYGANLPTITSRTYQYFDIDEKVYKDRVISINEFANKQPNCVLKHLGIIE